MPLWLHYKPQPIDTMIKKIKNKNKKRRPLQKDQCMYCEEMGQWKNECSGWKQPPLPQTQANPSYGGLARSRLLQTRPPGAYGNLHPGGPICKFPGGHRGYSFSITGATGPFSNQTMEVQGQQRMPKNTNGPLPRLLA